ncbi:MAG: hypothetical protein HY040_08365 [Planctomycetes bacterium]|nr:hypothetical protein [Planctomycetota bacterium]
MAKASKEKGESVMGYFRGVFKSNPKWLRMRSNDAVLQCWLRDHPNFSEVPKQIKNTLANVKSVLRHKRRGRKARAAAAANGGPGKSSRKPIYKGLELLEVQIDDCLSMARSFDSDGLVEVIRALRHARNQVVWKSGQSK